MKPDYQLITVEIPIKGIAYLILKDSNHLTRGVDEAIAAGATRMIVKGPVAEGERDGLQLTHAHDMLWMERTLQALPPLSGKLRLEPLTRAVGARYLDMLNEAFFRVPNGATVTMAELEERFFEPTCMAGTAFLGNQPVGVYELNLEKDVPEIAAIGLTRTMRGKGLGRELLRCVMNLLAQEGHKRCSLLVATSNENAFALYRAEGFVVTEKHAEWFEVRRV